MPLLLLLLCLGAVAGVVPRAGAADRHFTLVLRGSPAANEIHVSLSPDGATYTIDSSTALEVGEGLCANPAGKPEELICPASPITGFSFLGGPEDDVVIFGPSVPVSVTLIGGAGNDTLVGGKGGDRLVGGAGADTLIGRGGEDALYGGAGADLLLGGAGRDVCPGGSERDEASSCEVGKGLP